MSTYYEQMMRFVLAMVSADGEINASEMRFLKNLQKRFKMAETMFSTILEEAKQGFQKVRVPEDPAEKKKLFDLLVCAACADGNIAEKEEKILKTIASRFGIEEFEYDRQIQKAKEKTGQANSETDPQYASRICPKCGYRALSEQDPLIVGHNGDGECPACGIILSRYHDAQQKKALRQNDSRYSIDEFIQSSGQNDDLSGKFELENPYLLEVNLQGVACWAKLGSMIGYSGDVRFTREGILEAGVGKMFKKAITGEGTQLMKMDGRGRIYLADQGKRITILDLAGETIFVNGNDLLALEHTVTWDIKMMRRVAGMLAGGLFNVKLSGKGLVAITSHHRPLTIRVSKGNAICTDPNATVAWSGSLSPEIKTDVTFKTFLGRGSGESIQMKFVGEGWVVLQPFEEGYFGAR